MNQPIYFYLVNNKKYIDFHTLLYIYGEPDNELFERSNLWRYLKRSKIRRVLIGNKMVYLLDDIFSDTELVDKMANINALTSLADTLTED